MAYYEVLFLLFLFLQDEVKGVLGTLACIVMTFCDSYYFELMSEIGLLFYETAFTYDLIFFLFAFIIFDTTIGKCIILATFLSMGINLTGNFITSEYIYCIFVENYSRIQILLFEIIVAGCFASTWLAKYLKRKIDERTEKCYSKS